MKIEPPCALPMAIVKQAANLSGFTLEEQIRIHLSTREGADLVDAVNGLRQIIHELSPFKSEPVDFVKWVVNSNVTANDYNPNSVAPPEMELLRLSVSADGYTQPIVANSEDGRMVVVDGFHRHRVGKECKEVQERVKGYLPVVQIRSERVSVTDRMASTIRHNRARGKHSVQGMSDIVIELKRRNWSNDKIAKELGMDQDEILRLCQISGLIELFSDQSFSEAWEAEGSISVDDFEDLVATPATYVDEVEVRTANTDDEGRIFHPFTDWECHKAGFYNLTPPKGMTADHCRAAYRDFLKDGEAFSRGLEGVTTQWVKSCEHYLTNSAMNRIAWLGQAAMCYTHGIPSEFRSGYFLLTEDQQIAANALALVWLNKWLVANGRSEITMTDADPDRQSDIY